ncbi:MAG: hypothetical protein K8S16_11895, partial [Bacteroidales bacterium]|nr:hypothetical protein [Bacteroidales bacterium]
MVAKKILNEKSQTITTFLLFTTLGILFQSCATILGGMSNTLIITSSTQDSVQVYIDGEFAGKAPGKIKVDSRLIQHGSVLTLKSEGTPG